MFQIPISTNAQAVIAQVGGLTPRMLANIAKALDRENQLTIGHVQSDYLTGPRPAKLGVRTNRLRGSINASKAIVQGETVSSIIGTNVAYAGVHEHGFDGPVKVKAHTRRIFRTFTGTDGGTFDMATGRVKRFKAKKVTLNTGVANVKAFTRHMKMPKRPFLAPAIKGSELAYSTAISRAIEQSWKGGTK